MKGGLSHGYIRNAYPGSDAETQRSRGMKQLMDNPVYRAVIEQFAAQQEKGLKKYGTYVNVEDYDVIGWIEHAQQEMIDQLVYLEALKQKIKGEAKVGHQFEVGQKVKIKDGFAHIGESTKILECSTGLSGELIYRIDRYPGWWPHSSLTREVTQ